MNRNVQLAMAWCGFAFVAVFFTGLIISGFFPPVPPDNTAVEVADQYIREQDRIRIGAMIMMIATGFTMPFVAVISTQMARIEGRWTPLCFCQLIAGTIGNVAALVPVLMFLGISFRPQDRDPELIQAFNDFAWVPFIMNWPPAFVQVVCIAVVILGDRRVKPVFPRWVAYFLLWAAVAFLPASLVPFFTDGPLAWNGLLSFWLAAAFFGGLFLVMSYACIHAIKGQYGEDGSDCAVDHAASDLATR
ncbi:MAG: hypothetical protein ACT4PP_09830 [Sporichthyaceae bacterium]